MRQSTAFKLRPTRLVWRCYAIGTLAAYSLLTLGCAAGIVVGIWHELVTVSLIGSALGVYCASELRVLISWVRAADPTGPPVEPAWNVFVCALIFVALITGARWAWGP